MEPIVNVPIGDYDALRNRVKELEAENARLRSERDEICEKDKVRVIEREYEVEMPRCFGGRILSTKIKENLVNFDDVREVVEKNYKDEIRQEFSKELEEQRANKWEAQQQVKNLEREIELLKSRSLWQRIINKQ